MPAFYCEVSGMDNVKPFKFRLSPTRHLLLRYFLFNKITKENVPVTGADFTPWEKRRILRALQREYRRAGIAFTNESIDSLVLRYTLNPNQTLNHAISADQLARRSHNRRRQKDIRVIPANRSVRLK